MKNAINNLSHLGFTSLVEDMNVYKNMKLNINKLKISPALQIILNLLLTERSDCKNSFFKYTTKGNL